MLSRIYFLACTARLALTTAVIAAPLDARQTPQEYYLQTSVIFGANDTGTNKTGLYVYAYHTGAGFNDAVLSPNISIASKGYLNDTNWQFDLGTPTLPWYFALSDIDYASWNAAEINSASAPTSNFSINGTSLEGPASYGFGGWLACDWYHQSPQLFWLNFYYNVTVLPTSCSTVSLQLVAV